MNHHGKTKDRFLRKNEVMAITGLSNSTIWRLEKNGKFPRKRQISEKTVAWLESEIHDWINSREIC